MTQPSSEFFGLDGFVWFVGVVEDRKDPLLLGRVRVRCLGFHTENLSDLPTIDLPWAHVMHPVTSPSMNGLGHTPTFMVEGTWVVGFFRDSEEKQLPIIIGTLPGVPTKPKSGVGFADPFGYYPSSKGLPHSGHKIGEPDTSRLARGVVSEEHTALKNRRKNRVKGIPVATKPKMSSTLVSLESDLGDESEDTVAGDFESAGRNAPSVTAPDTVGAAAAGGAGVAPAQPTD